MTVDLQILNKIHYCFPCIRPDNINCEHLSSCRCSKISAHGCLSQSTSSPIDPQALMPIHLKPDFPQIQTKEHTAKRSNVLQILTNTCKKLQILATASPSGLTLTILTINQQIIVRCLSVSRYCLKISLIIMCNLMTNNVLTSLQYNANKLHRQAVESTSLETFRTGHSPEQPALDDPALSRKLDYMTSRCT